MVAELETIAGERPFWLVLDGLEVCDTVANGVAQLVEALLVTLDTVPHLNMALIGWQGDFRSQQAEVLTGAASIEDIVDHLLLDLAPPGSVIPQNAKSTFAMVVDSVLQQQPSGPPYVRAAAAAVAAREMIRPILAGFARAGLAAPGRAGE